MVISHERIYFILRGDLEPSCDEATLICVAMHDCPETAKPENRITNTQTGFVALLKIYQLVADAINEDLNGTTKMLQKILDKSKIAR